MSATEKPTSIIDICCEFLEIAIHNILYTRNLYPRRIFETKRKYGVVVYQSIHPTINTYITDCLKAVHFHLNKNQLRDLYVCFINSITGEVLDRVHIEILTINCHNKSTTSVDPLLIELEQYLRDFCLKLHNSNNYLQELPEDEDNLSFTIQLNVTEYSNLELNQQSEFEDFPWISLNNNKKITQQLFEIIPIHSIESNDLLKLQIYIEK